MAGSLATEDERVSRFVPWAIALVAVLFVAVLYRTAALFVVKAWLSDPYYTHGLPVFLVALGLGGWRVARFPRERAEASSLVLIGLVAAIALYAYGFVRHDAYALAWSGYVFLASSLALTGGWPRLKLLAMPLVLLALTIPTPWTLDRGTRMQAWAFAGVTAILHVFGTGLTTGLTTFNVRGLDFDITPACSGFQSAISLLAIGAVITSIAPMSYRRRLLVLAVALPIALLLNIGRILLIVGIGLRYGADAANGFFHQWSSGVLFIAETLTLIAVAGLLRRRTSVTEAK